MGAPCYAVLSYWANVDGRMSGVSWAGVRSVFRAEAAAKHDAELPGYAPTKRRTAVLAVTPEQAAQLLGLDWLRGAQFRVYCQQFGVEIPA